MRNFGLHDRRVSLGGSSTDAPVPRDIYAPRDSVLLPPGNLAFPRSNFLQSLFDILAIMVGMLLISATGISLAFCLFVLLFIELH